MRAIVERISFALFQVTKSLEETIGPVQNMYASGGFVHSKEWLQILADISGSQIHVTNASDASALGAAILGLYATGVLKNLSEPKSFISVRESYHPHDHQHRIYMANYAIYASLYQVLKEQFSKLEILYSL